MDLDAASDCNRFLTKAKGTPKVLHTFGASNTWLHRPTPQNVKKALANPEPSTHGTSRHLVRRTDMSEVRGRPEVIGWGQNNAFGPQRTLRAKAEPV
jgi:hypothetical protein